MDDITVNQWMRIPRDFVTIYDESGEPVGKLPRTYGIQILEIGREFIRVFSPDLNKNVFLRKEDLKGSEQNG